MPYTASFTDPAPTPEELAEWPGTVVVEFGTDWCPHCQGAQPWLQAALHDRRDLVHIKMEDGPGRRLGRHFKVKQWPTLVVVRDSEEIGRVVRPTSADAVEAQLPVAI